MTQRRGRAFGLAVVALTALVLAGCGGSKAANSPGGSGTTNNAPAAQTSSSSGSGGYGY